MLHGPVVFPFVSIPKPLAIRMEHKSNSKWRISPSGHAKEVSISFLQKGWTPQPSLPFVKNVKTTKFQVNARILKTYLTCMVPEVTE